MDSTASYLMHSWDADQIKCTKVSNQCFPQHQQQLISRLDRLLYITAYKYSVSSYMSIRRADCDDNLLFIAQICSESAVPAQPINYHAENFVIYFILPCFLKQMQTSLKKSHKSPTKICKLIFNYLVMKNQRWIKNFSLFKIAEKEEEH